MNNGTFKNLQGTKDYIPNEYANLGISSNIFRFVEDEFVKLAKSFNFQEMIMPIIENSNLYNRSVGESSDIVNKEMYLMESGKETIALRPEGTAGLVRSYVQNKLYTSPNETVKLFYRGSMFRRERPQAGRQKEFTQLGAEAIGGANAFLDAEVISFAALFFKQLGLTNIELQINSIGCKSCRNQYINALKNFIESLEDMCDDCKVRKDKNVLRVLDCKNNSCQKNYEKTPLISDFLCQECENDFELLKETLTLLDIDFTTNPKLVRGLDYYNNTAFEFIDTSIGAQSTVCGGGRYTNLISDFGGPENSGVGFGIGLERLLISLSNQNKLPQIECTIDYFLAWTNEETRNVQMKIAQNLRRKGFSVEMEFNPKKLKNQLKVANRKNAKFALIIGEDELRKGVVTFKDLSQGTQKEVSLTDFLY